MNQSYGAALMRKKPADRRCPLGHPVQYQRGCGRRKVPFCEACGTIFPRRDLARATRSYGGARSIEKLPF